MTLRTKLAALAWLITCLSPSAHAEGSNDVETLLQRNEMQKVEAFFSGVQRSFESGQFPEGNLREVFRLFQDMDVESERNLESWADRSPTSYVAHLALGTHYLRRGWKARGGSYMSQVPSDHLEEMTTYLHKADRELSASLSLTAKPYLSALYLIDVYGIVGQRDLLKASLMRANAALPSNALARRAYANYLLPRWGGSYRELDELIESTRREGIPSSVTMQLEAMKYNDMGSALEESGEHAAAREKFEQALQLGEKVGGRFSIESLRISRKYMCSGEQSSKSYCR